MAAKSSKRKCINRFTNLRQDDMKNLTGYFRSVRAEALIG